MAVRLEPAPNTSGDLEATPSDRARGRRGDRRWSAITRLWPAALCCILYIVLAMVTYGHYSSLGPDHMAGIGTMDSIVQIWWLAWAAHAVPQVHSLFLTQGQNYPLGQNFGINGSMLALGVVFMPVTKLFGPVVTWNLLLRLSLAGSATSMCLVLRRWTTWWPAAFLGGLLYGFSAYTLHLGAGAHLFLIFVPLPPVIFLLIHEILVRQNWRPGRTGVLLGVACALQFFISTEVFASTVIMGTIAIALILSIGRHTLIDRWRYAVTAFAYSLGVGCVLLFYPLLLTFTGPQHINGPPTSSAKLTTQFPSDLLSPVVPYGQWFEPRLLTQVADRLINGRVLYLGLPLIVVLACFSVFFRKRKAILFAGAMALIAFVLSLGPRLWIDGHETQLPLPFALFEHLPAIDGFLASRFALYTGMFAAGMFAIGIDELWQRLRRPGHLVRLSAQWSMVGRPVVLGAIAVAVTLPLVPSHTQPASPTSVPTFFTSTAVDSIPADSVVLAYPYPDQTSTAISSFQIFSNLQPVHSAMIDQAVARMRYKLIGGYGWFPAPTRHDGTTSPALLEPQSVQTLFDVALSGVETPAQRAVLSNSNLTSDLRVFLREFNVQTVIVADPHSVLRQGGVNSLGGSSTVISHVTAAIGLPVRTGGVTVWFHVRQRLAP